MKTCNIPVRKTIPAAFCFAVAMMIIISNAFAGVYYISPTGNDAVGKGTAASPWKTLFKACSSVTTPGDIIHVNAGTYTETVQCSLAPGVSIEGDGQVTTILKSTLNAAWTEMLALRSAEGTNGNQHISFVTFDGSNLTTFWGVYIAGRSNVSVHDVTMKDFKNRGIIISGRNDNTNAAPSIYATGNTFYNNIVTNCAEYDQILGYGAGCINIGGQQDMLIYNNTITQNSRAAGFNGWPIKYWLNGYLKGLKIYNNTLNKVLNAFPLGDNNWDFAIELFNTNGLEVYNNTLNGGSIDLNYISKGTYTNGAWIHDNSIIMPTLNSNIQTGITLEFNVADVLIENNVIDKTNVGILFTPREGNSVQNVVIRKNLITGVGMAESTGFLINMGQYGANNITWNNINIFNNTLIEDPAHPTFWGIKLPNSTSAPLSNFNIKNNIIANAYSAAIVVQEGTVGITNLQITNNDIYGNGFNNAPYYALSPGSGYVYSKNITNVAYFATGSYNLSAASPCIDAGTNVGLPFAGVAPDAGYAEFSSALPVKLIEFTISQNSGSNILQWKTASEINSSHFVVQRSKDGVVFEDLSSQPASGFSNTIKSYSYTDALPLSGINYYRLILVDKDKREEYSGIIFVRPGYDNSLEIITARVSSLQNSLAITVSSKQNEKALLHVVDNNGKVLLTQSVLLQKGTNYFDKTIQNVSQGIYYVRLQTATETRVKNILSSN